MKKMGHIKVVKLMIGSFLFAGSAFGGTINLAWDAPGDSTITGYKVHRGTSSRNYSTILDVGNVRQTSIANLNANTSYFFAATSYNSSGTQSDLTPELNYGFSSVTNSWICLSCFTNPTNLRMVN